MRSVSNALRQWILYAAQVTELEHADVVCAFAWREELRLMQKTLSATETCLLSEADLIVEKAAPAVMKVLALTPWAGKQPPHTYVGDYYRRHLNMLP